MKKVQFDGCSCEFEYNENGGIDFDFNTIVLDCPSAWNIFETGRTVGVFQCESFQMSSMSKRFKPKKHENLCDLIAAVRPGVLNAVVDENGTKAIDRYLAVMNGEYIPTYLCPELERILSPTHSIILYQEQIIEIAKSIAGFTLSEADFLRKGIGKKDTAIVAECRITFLAGAKKVGMLSEKDAEWLFDQIEKSARYSFNKSHSWSYADTAYATAYLKAHFPKTFTCSSLYHAQFSTQKALEEVKKNVQDARRLNIDVLPPALELFQPHFDVLGGKIRFGLSDIKDISETTANHLADVAANGEAELRKPFKNWNWLEFLIFFSTNQIQLNSGIKFTPSSTVISRLIKVGALDYPMYRQEMLFEYERVWKVLSDGQRKWIRKNYTPKWKSLADAIKAVAPSKKNGGGSHDSKGTEVANDLLKLMKNRPADIKDTAMLIAQDEKAALGVPISCSALDENKFKGACNITCKEYADGASRSVYRLIGEIKAIKVITCKNGKSAGRQMAFITLDDNTVELESITAFSDEYELYEHLLYETGIVYIEGTRDKNRGTLIVRKVHSA